MLFVHNYPEGSCQASHDEEHVSPMLETIKAVVSNPQTWINGLYVGLLFAPTAVFAEFWGVSFLTNVYHIPRAEAANADGIIFIAWFLGGPLAGWLSDRLKRRRVVMQISAFLGFILLSAIIYIPSLPFSVVFILLFIYGFTNTGVAISYALAGEINPRKIAGTSIAFANMASIAIGALLQPVTGAILDAITDGNVAAHGIDIFTPMQFRTGMILLPICSLLSLLCTFFIKETHCKSVA